VTAPAKEQTIQISKDMTRALSLSTRTSNQSRKNKADPLLVKSAGVLTILCLIH